MSDCPLIIDAMPSTRSFASIFADNKQLTFSISLAPIQRNGKSSACNVLKISDNSASRPDRLLSRLKLINSVDDSVPRLIVIRSPKGPDGKGFLSSFRQPRLAGKFNSSLERPDSPVHPSRTSLPNHSQFHRNPGRIIIDVVSDAP